jgi:hypothetical protein
MTPDDFGLTSPVNAGIMKDGANRFASSIG